MLFAFVCEGRQRAAAAAVMTAVIVSAAAVVVCTPFRIDEHEGVAANDAPMHPSRAPPYPSLTACRGRSEGTVGGREILKRSTPALSKGNHKRHTYLLVCLGMDGRVAAANCNALLVN